MNNRFFITGFVTSILNLILHASAYFFFLKRFFEKHPAGSEEFLRQLNKPPEKLIVWAMIVTSLTMGFLITIVMKWSGARTVLSGLKYGFLIAFLFWSSVNSGIYASSNMFSQAGMLADLACST